LPELGVLLQVERELPALIKEIYGEHGYLFQEEDEAEWRKAETRLRAALTEFTRAFQSTYQARLFVHDALDGLRLIDLMRETFDAVVMNPPFGALPVRVKAYLFNAYPRSKIDSLALFVERGLSFLKISGRLGAITSRACFYLNTYTHWRKEVVLKMGRPEVLADLGNGVMDDAMVEAAAYVLEAQQ
jgi:hypothetical protein